MSISLSQKTDITDSGTTQGAFRTGIASVHDILSAIPGSKPAATIAISAGGITPSGNGIILVDTEASSASDDLDNIIGANVADGGLLYIRASNASRTVTVRNGRGGSGQIITEDGYDLVLDNTQKTVVLKYNESNDRWDEVLRSSSLIGGVSFETTTHSSAFSLTSADISSTHVCTGTFTVTIGAANTFKNGDSFVIANDGNGVITLTRSGSDTFVLPDEVAAQGTQLQAGQSAFVICDAATRFFFVSQSSSKKTMETFKFTATGGETSVSGNDDDNKALSYTPNAILLTLNGVELVEGDDYTATTGTSVTGLAALTAGDILKIRAFKTFAIADELDKVSTEGDTQVARVIAKGDEESSAVQLTGIAERGNVANEGTAQIAAVQAEGATQTSNMQTYAQNVADIVNGATADTFFRMDANGDFYPNTSTPANSTVWAQDGNGDFYLV